MAKCYILTPIRTKVVKTLQVDLSLEGRVYTALVMKMTIAEEKIGICQFCPLPKKYPAGRRFSGKACFGKFQGNN
jgi:hypothetical protein